MSLDDDCENWTDEETAPVPSRVFKKGVMLIDKEILNRISAKHLPRVQERLGNHAVSFGRRALEVAILKAVGTRFTNPSRSSWEPAWIEVRDTSVVAERSLKKLFDSFDRSGRTSKNLAPFLAQSRLGRDTTFTIKERQRRAKRDAVILVAAHKIIKSLAADTERRRAAFVQLHPGGNTDFEKNAFVHTLAEAWTFLMARRPGASPLLEENPFLQLVEAAWQDWHGAEAIWEDKDRRVSFVAAMNAARSMISSQEAEWLRINGPSWR